MSKKIEAMDGRNIGLHFVLVRENTDEDGFEDNEWVKSVYLYPDKMSIEAFIKDLDELKALCERANKDPKHCIQFERAE